MKKFITTAIIAVAAAIIPLTACNSAPDYCNYISEKRSEIYIYRDDTVDITVNCVSREQPYNADGIRGEMCDTVEIFVKITPTPDEVEISLEGYTGEMNYEAVEQRFAASYSAPAYHSDGIDILVNADGTEKNYRVLGVLDGGVMSCEQALGCVIEYDRQLFDSLTLKNDFAGEIFVRLLYDEGCYYYVGVCDRDKNITAYLVDGGVGKIIATKKIKG